MCILIGKKNKHINCIKVTEIINVHKNIKRCNTLLRLIVNISVYKNRYTTNKNKRQHINNA